MKVGIDFGTSTSEIGCVDSGGNIVVIPNHLGESITPSVVYIPENGDPIVGREAKEKAVIEPENTFIEVKRLFGQNAELTARGKTYTPVDAAAMIIRYLADCAREHTGEAVDSAVITVPAYFTDSQRKDVMAAGQAAGLSVDRIINEPTAASLDYGINHMRDCDYMLVYDLGGGTLDVTVLELFEGVVEVKSSCGNNALGGKDFDKAIIDYVTKKIKRGDKVDVTGDARAMMRIKMAAEQCKIALSADTEYMLELPFLYTKNGNPAGYSEKITRLAFEEMIQEQIFSTNHQIKTALFDAGLEASDIGLTLMVGGSTRIPLVSFFLEDTFGFDPKMLTDPDLSVVRGAAIQSGVLSGVLNENAIVLTDICPHSLSTEVLSGELHEMFCDILIKRNTTLPASFSKMYITCADNQTRVFITAYQGESLDPEENYLLNSFELSGIPKAKAGKEKINITFEYDLNGILTVSAEIVSTGKSAEIAVDTALMGKNLDLSAWKNSPRAKQYRSLISKAERLAEVHGADAQYVEAAANELKKAIVMGWESEVINHMQKELTEEIEIFEEDEDEEGDE